MGVSSFQSVIIMKTGEEFHVEKENYGRPWQSFTERLEEGKTELKSTLPLPNKERSRITLFDTKKRKKKQLFKLRQPMLYVPLASDS